MVFVPCIATMELLMCPNCDNLLHLKTNVSIIEGGAKKEDVEKNEDAEPDANANDDDVADENEDEETEAEAEAEEDADADAETIVDTETVADTELNADRSDDETDVPGDINAIYYYCEICGYKNDEITNNTVLYSNVYTKKDKIESINKNLIYSTSHARTIHRPCVNSKCESYGKSDIQESVIIRNAQKETKFMCIYCTSVI